MIWLWSYARLGGPSLSRCRSDLVLAPASRTITSALCREHHTINQLLGIFRRSELKVGTFGTCGGKMALCRYASMATLLIGIAVSGVPALAQYYSQPTQAELSNRPVADEQQDVLRPPRTIGQDVTGAIAPRARTAMPPEVRPETGPSEELPPHFRRTLVNYRTPEPVGTIIVDTPNTYLYLVVENGKALRYGIGVGREGFTWAGSERISKIAEWPDWHPPAEMIEREPHLPRFMAGGEGNPLGARALYLGKSIYRIHGTNQPSTIGTFVSSGCIRLTNGDIIDLYARVQVGTRVVVLPGRPTTTAAASGSNTR